MDIYDLIIVGGGPGGLAAAIYGARAKLKTLVLEKGVFGGQIFTTREICNYPGVFKDTGGPDLMKTWVEHAEFFGAEFLRENVVDLDLSGSVKTVRTKKGNTYQAKALILSPGAVPRALNVPGEKKHKGNGVSYCATCDADFHQDQHVVVVGNGDAAVEEACHLTRFASKVSIIVIHEEGHLDCNRASADKAKANPKIEFIWNSVLHEVKGEYDVEAAVIRNLKTGELTESQVSGVFIYVGSIPNTGFLQDKIQLNKLGYIITNGKMETSQEGVYAVGDARDTYLRQVVTAASDGAIAAVTAERYIAEEEFFQTQLNQEGPVLLLFWNPSSEACIQANAVVDDIAGKHEPKIHVVKVDTYRNTRIPTHYNVAQSPTLLLLENGKAIETLNGRVDEQSLRKVLTKINRR